MDINIKDIGKIIENEKPLPYIKTKYFHHIQIVNELIYWVINKDNYNLDETILRNTINYNLDKCKNIPQKDFLYIFNSLLYKMYGIENQKEMNNFYKLVMRLRKNE